MKIRKKRKNGRNLLVEHLEYQKKYEVRTPGILWRLDYARPDSFGVTALLLPEAKELPLSLWVTLSGPLEGILADAGHENARPFIQIQVQDEPWRGEEAEMPVFDNWADLNRWVAGFLVARGYVSARSS